MGPVTALSILALWCGMVSCQEAEFDALEDLTAASIAQFVGVPRNQNPTIAVIGFSKCGTTSTAFKLEKAFGHDILNVPIRKELDVLHLACDDLCIWDYQQNHLNAKGGRPYTMDASPVYSMHPYPAMRNLERANPEAALILLLREPVSRVRSAYHYFKGSGHPHDAFTFAPQATIIDLVTYELDLLESSSSAMEAIDVLLDRYVDAEAVNEALEILQGTLNHTHASPVLGSMYLGQLLAWRERLVSSVGSTLIVNTDKYYGNEGFFFAEIVFPFIFGGPDAPGLTAQEREERMEIKQRWTVHQKVRHAQYGPEDEYTPDLACRLQRFYEPIVERVRELLLEFQTTSKGRTFIYPAPSQEVWWPESARYCGD